MISFKGKYYENVFINCPFDKEYKKMFRAVVFAIQSNGFYPRCALEKIGGDVRLTKICKIISECKYGLHDISRTKPDKNGNPRFNMPFELGLFIGCKNYGDEKQNSKDFLVLDKEKYRYQKTISDLSGIDLIDHDNKPINILKIVNLWLAEKRWEITGIPENYTGEQFIEGEYRQFEKKFPDLCLKHKVDINNYKFVDLYIISGLWIKERKKYVVDDAKTISIKVTNR